MSETTIFDAMDARVEADCHRVRDKARLEVEAIVSEAREAASARRAEALEEIQGELRAELEEVRRQADARAGVRALALRQQVADEVLGRAGTELRALACGDTFGETLEMLLAEAMDAAEGDARVSVPQGHQERCRTWLDRNGSGDTAVTEGEDLVDGVVVSGVDGTWRIENTLTRRFERLLPEARKRCVARLFAEDE
ncbi:MAG: hypothetical protein GY851_05250 [bacterium]|nr:hypothetical protein [bacterium]